MSSNRGCSCWNCVEARKRRELIDFAKTGAPPEPKDCKEFCGDDDCTCDLAWVDKSPTYSAVLKARGNYEDRHTPETPARAVPRMFEQKPYEGLLPKRDGYDPRCCHKTVLQRCEGCPYDAPKAARPESLNAFAREVHASNAHWWHDPATGEKLDRNMGEMLMLVVSEIAECMEGERKNLMDDHLPHRKMAEVELADAVIRIADIAGAHGYSLECEVRWPRGLTDNKSESLLLVSVSITDAYELQTATGELTSESLSEAMSLIEAYAAMHGYDLWGAVAEKREYNKHRADHKPEARLAANGKKF